MLAFTKNNMLKICFLELAKNILGEIYDFFSMFILYDKKNNFRIHLFTSEFYVNYQMSKQFGIS